MGSQIMSGGALPPKPGSSKTVSCYTEMRLQPLSEGVLPLIACSRKIYDLPAEIREEIAKHAATHE